MLGLLRLLWRAKNLRRPSNLAKRFAQRLTNIDVEVTREYRAAEAQAFLEASGIDLANAAEIDGAFVSAFIRARKP